LGGKDNLKSFSQKAYCTEENFIGKKLWQMNLTAELAKKTLTNGPCCRFGEKFFWRIGQKEL